MSAPIGESIFVATAPVSRQVDSGFWAELRTCHARGGLPGVITRNEWRIGDTLVGVAKTSTDYTDEARASAAWQGLHRRRVLVVVDEASGVRPWLYRSLPALMRASNQMIAWGVGDVAKTLGIPKENVRLISPYIGGGFGGKLFLRADAVMAALAARQVNRPVKIALQRPLIMNNTTHRPATIQRIRICATPDGKITAIGHESWSGDQPGGQPETAVSQTRLLYAGENRMTALRLAVLDLPEGNAMRAPGEAPGLMALEIAMDEMAEKLRLDPIEFRIRNDTQVSPDIPAKPNATDPQSKAPQEKHNPHPPFSQRQLVECLRLGAERFGWKDRNSRPGQSRDGVWLRGLGMAAAFRNNIVMKSAARVRLDDRGIVTVETDMTDIGTGSYTIIAQTAAEMMGVPIDHVVVKLGDSSFPISCGSGGQFGGNNSTAGVCAACISCEGGGAKPLRHRGAAREMDMTSNGAASRSPKRPVQRTGRRGQHRIWYARQAVPAVDVRRAFCGSWRECGDRRNSGAAMLAVCAAGRILNPKTARSQVIGDHDGGGCGVDGGARRGQADGTVCEPRSG